MSWACGSGLCGAVGSITASQDIIPRLSKTLLRFMFFNVFSDFTFHTRTPHLAYLNYML